MGSEPVVRRQILAISGMMNAGSYKRPMISLTFLLEGLNDAPFLFPVPVEAVSVASALCDGFEKRKGNFPPVEGFCSLVRDSPYRPEARSLPRKSDRASPAGAE